MTTSGPLPASAVVSDLGEHALIARIRARIGSAPAWLVVGVGDDAAVYEPDRGALQVVTTDTVVDGVHVDRAFVPFDAMGHRALAVNLSDLAAMGATPRLATLSLALPPDLALADFDALVDGVLALAHRTSVTVVGGNITATSGPLVIDVTAIGAVRRRRVLTRAGASPGDAIVVSGSLGDAAAGLARCRLERDAGDWDGRVRERYLRPEPRLRLGRALGAARAAGAVIDLSDGLADGLQQIATSSGVGLEVDAALVPIEADARRVFEEAGRDPVEAAIGGGDDYELLFTVPARRLGRLRQVRRVARVPLTRIGTVTAGRGVTITGASAASPDALGFEHFRTVSAATGP